MYSNTRDIDFPRWWDVLDGRGGEPNEELFAAEEMEGPDVAGGPSRHGGDGGGPGVDGGEAPGFGASGDEPEDSAADEEWAQFGLYARRAGPRGYGRDEILDVWDFAEVVPGVDPELWRRDEFGDWICRLDYGHRRSEFGWEIFDPDADRLTRGVYAKRPMQWCNFVKQYEAWG